MIQLIIDNFKEQIDINFKDKFRWCLCFRKGLSGMNKYELVKLLIDNFKDQININIQNEENGQTVLVSIEQLKNFKVSKY